MNATGESEKKVLFQISSQSSPSSLTNTRIDFCSSCIEECGVEQNKEQLEARGSLLHKERDCFIKVKCIYSTRICKALVIIYHAQYIACNYPWVFRYTRHFLAWFRSTTTCMGGSLIYLPFLALLSKMIIQVDVQGFFKKYSTSTIKHLKRKQNNICYMIVNDLHTHTHLPKRRDENYQTILCFKANCTMF